MDMYPKYKSPFGYQVGDNGIDSYGVDHRGFSLRDEIEYQTARDQRESQMMQMYNQQGITENYPQYTTNFWGDAGNNYGFGSSNISSAISAHPAMNTTPIPLQTVQTSMPQTQTATTLGTNRAIPRIWESAADGKHVYDYVIQQEGNFVSPDQNMFSYDWSVLRTVPNMINNYMNLKDMKLVDKYKHAYMNCEASQFGKGGSDIASIVSNLRE